MFYLIDKPAGISSFDAIRKLRKILNIRKMWHTGTLDPFATWCLLIATDNSTKLIPLLESSEKEYYCTITLDGTSLSLDTETEIIPIDISCIQKKSNEEISEFLLSITSQIPPNYSAIHIDGKRAYEKARKWHDFTLKPREIIVHEAEVITRSATSISLRLIVSSWCYIRSFAPVIGEFLGTKWWYLTELRRTKIKWKYWMVSIEDATDFINVSPISYSILFHTIHTHEIWEQIMRKLIDWKNIPIEEFDFEIENDIFFLSNEKLCYVSLCKRKNREIIPLKNNV